MDTRFRILLKIWSEWCIDHWWRSYLSVMWYYHVAEAQIWPYPVLWVKFQISDQTVGTLSKFWSGWYIILPICTKENHLFKCIEALCRHLSPKWLKKISPTNLGIQFCWLVFVFAIDRVAYGCDIYGNFTRHSLKICYGYGQNFVACRVMISAYPFIAGLVWIIRCTCELLNCWLEMCLLIRAMSQNSFRFGDTYHITWRCWSELKYLQRHHISMFV